MTNIAQMTDLEQRRLAWRCRRGLLELDIILQRFAANHLATITTDELVAFNTLLDYPDNTFLDAVLTQKAMTQKVMTQQTNNPDLQAPAMQSLLAKLNAEY